MKLSFALLMFASLIGCSGRNLHPELTEKSEVLQRQWTRSETIPIEAGERSAEYSNPIVVQETLIYGTRADGLIALYPRFNQVRWRIRLKGGIASPINADGPNVYFVGGDGFLYSVRVDDGRIEWKTELKNPLVSKATVSGGRVFVTSSDDILYAFDSGTGKWLWHYRRPNVISSTIHGASQPMVDGVHVFSGFTDGTFACFNINDGSLVWERKLHYGSKFTDVDARAILDQGVIYVPAYDGALYALKREGGDILWKMDAGGAKQVIVDDDHLYFPSSDGNVYAIQKSNGKELWKFSLDRGTPTQLVMNGPNLIFGSSFQYLYVLNKQTGKALSRFNVGWGSGFSGAPGFDSNTKSLYMISGAGNLYSFLVK